MISSPPERGADTALQLHMRVANVNKILVISLLVLFGGGHIYFLMCPFGLLANLLTSFGFSNLFTSSNTEKTFIVDMIVAVKQSV